MCIYNDICHPSLVHFKAADPVFKVHVVMCLVLDFVILRKCDSLVILTLSQLSLLGWMSLTNGVTSLHS